MSIRNGSLLAVAVFCSASFLSAQESGPPPGGGGPPPPPGAFGGGPGPGPGMMGMRPGKTVTGAPYSADVSTSLNQTLTDGNTISRVNNGHVARDSQGRTYSQQNITGGPWA